MRVEQAIFTSIQSERLNGYQLAATSPGISAERAKELTLWGPAHDSLVDARPGVRSINFHAVAGGEFCLSCTTIAGSEYSGRGGGRVYTQMFVLTAEHLERFANDPFLILRAIDAGGRLVVQEQVPAKLAAMSLVGRCEQIDSQVVAQVLDDVGIASFDEILAGLGGTASVAVATSAPVEKLFQALLHALPAETRTKCSFTTGLKHSPRRPFKLFTVPGDESTIRQSQRLTGARVVELGAVKAA